MHEEWQFTCAFAAIYGCHISIKCPTGGLESAKEYHNFKNFYSIVVMMAMVDAKYRIIWASTGFACNAHDSIVFQASDIYAEIARGNRLPFIAQREGNLDMPPLLLGDSAFPFHTWHMKPYGNAVLTPEQRYFNYRLSRARMATKGAYGKLKGRWHVLSSKCESKVETVKSTEDAVPPEFRLGVCLYRLGRGNYCYTISELAVLGVSTVCEVVIEVSQAIVENLLDNEVASHFPQNANELRRKMEEMDEKWQFTCAFAAIYGCHISIKCPAGALESAKEYHNFKNFYSIVMMAMVDAKYRII